MAAHAGFADGINIRIIIDLSYNAFRAGRQTIYLHSGLLLSATSAEEIYGVIAHEIGHLAAGHVPLRSEMSAGGTCKCAYGCCVCRWRRRFCRSAIGVAIGGTDNPTGCICKKAEQMNQPQMNGQSDYSIPRISPPQGWQILCV